MNPAAPSEPFVTDVTVQSVGAHEHVRVFVKHALVGTLVCGEGDGERLERILQGERSLVDLVREKKQRLFIEDVPWFVKDFDVLYRAANQFVQRMHGVPDEAAQNALRALTAQLARLAHPAAQCAAVRSLSKNRSDP